jgi:hypothetical protein
VFSPSVVSSVLLGLFEPKVTNHWIAGISNPMLFLSIENHQQISDFLNTLELDLILCPPNSNR